jgi:hypothetical protein
MRLVTFEEYLEYVKMHEKVTIEDETIIVGKPHKIEKYQPDDFILERSSVWSFPHRGDWATHKGDYRGNWAPQIPRNLLLRYSRPGEIVLDQMCGGGTTLVECKLLGRNAIGVDINYEAVILTLDRLNFSYTPLDEDYKEPNIKVYHGDARNLNLINDESIDLIATHPPHLWLGCISFITAFMRCSSNALSLDFSALYWVARSSCDGTFRSTNLPLSNFARQTKKS